jgi:hypothetical protein
MSPAPRAAFLQNIVHLLTVLVLLLKAITKLAHPHGLWPVILFFLAAAGWILAITLLHHKLHRHTRLLTASVLALEAIATALVALLYHLEGKHALPWVTALAAVGFAIALIVHLRQTRPGNGPHGEGVTGA